MLDSVKRSIAILGGLLTTFITLIIVVLHFLKSGKPFFLWSIKLIPLGSFIIGAASVIGFSICIRLFHVKSKNLDFLIRILFGFLIFILLYYSFFSFTGLDEDGNAFYKTAGKGMSIVETFHLIKDKKQYSFKDYILSRMDIVHSSVLNKKEYFVPSTKVDKGKYGLIDFLLEFLGYFAGAFFTGALVQGGFKLREATN